jgi:PAS domain S-box-containing protein
MATPDPQRHRPPALDRERIAGLVLDGARDFAIFTVDPEGIVTTWNAGAERLFGWTEAEMAGRDSCIIFTQEDLRRGACDNERATARDRGRAEDERWHVRKDGSLFWASGLLMRLEDEESGAHLGYVKMVRDRTLQHEQNEEKLALHRHSAEILESISDAFYAVDADWRFTYVNRRAEQWWGRSRRELIGKVYWQEFPQAVGSQAYDAHLQAMRERRPVDIETLSPILGRWVAVAIHPTDAGGLSVYFRDITSRREREAALADSEARLRLAVDAARLAVWEYDAVAERLLVTPELALFLGLSEAELADREALRARYGEGDRDRIRGIAEGALARGERYFEVEFRFRREEDWRWLLLRAEIILAAAGGAERVLGVLVDITERKRAEEALRKLTDTLEEQVAQRTRELLLAEEALRQSQKMEAIGQLTGGVAHDFNNLLTIIRSSADLLRRPDVSVERQRRYMDAISETVDRAAKLTGQLLAFARRQALDPEVFDAAERLRRIRDMVKTVAGATVELDMGTDCEGCFVEADAGQFETAIINLAVNARDAMAGEGKLTLRVRRDAGEVAVSVCDTGSGIAPEALPHIFEPFFTTKEVGKGTGLGLSQVYGFAKQSGGDVEVESAPGQGTTFTLLLPRVAPCAEGGSEARLPPETPARGLRILVVEDNVQVGEFAMQLLHELGHQPVLAGNGEAALTRLEAQAAEFDLVFTDVVMPGMTGIELAQAVRRRWPGLRVVLTSGYSHVLAEQGSQGFELLRKPYSVERLAAVLGRQPAG